MKSPPFKPETYFHLYNSGVDRRVIFSSKEDFDRFEAYLYLLNAVESPRAANLFAGGRESEIFHTARGEKLVAIGAYSFIAQQFQLLVTPLVDGGIGKFMQKLQTAYTMYFNKKYAHQGRLFHSAYKSRSIASEDDIRSTFSKIHLSPALLFNDDWEHAEGMELATLITRALQYRYSSAGEYESSKFVITDPDSFPSILRRTKTAQSHFAILIRSQKKQGRVE